MAVGIYAKFKLFYKPSQGSYVVKPKIYKKFIF